MTDKEYRKQKARVKKFWGKWFNTLGLHWWGIDLYWQRERNEDEPSELGHTSSNWQYRTAAVTFNIPVVAEINDDKLEEAVVHEMTHILVAPIQDFRDDQARDITELTVTTVARALIWSREAGKRDKPLGNGATVARLAVNKKIAGPNPASPAK